MIRDYPIISACRNPSHENCCIISNQPLLAKLFACDNATPIRNIRIRYNYAVILINECTS